MFAAILAPSGLRYHASGWRANVPHGARSAADTLRVIATDATVTIQPVIVDRFMESNLKRGRDSFLEKSRVPFSEITERLHVVKAAVIGPAVELSRVFELLATAAVDGEE